MNYTDLIIFVLIVHQVVKKEERNKKEKKNERKILKVRSDRMRQLHGFRIWMRKTIALCAFTPTAQFDNWSSDKIQDRSRLNLRYKSPED